jgi:hypothetical protein
MGQVATELERHRAAVLSRHLARLASKRVNVVSIRARLFGGRKLTRKQAQTLLDQFGPRYLPASWFEKNGIPLLGHRSSMVDPSTGIPPTDATNTMVLRFEWDGGSLDVPDAWRLMADATSQGLRLRLPRGELYVLEGSVFADIQAVASSLADHYDWSPSAASLFVMTGNPPPVYLIGVRQIGGWRDDHTHFAFELRVEPWVSPNSVAQAFRQLQHDAYGHQVIGLKKRALVLFEFIEEYREKKIRKSWPQMKEESLDFPWAKAAKLWNQKHTPGLFPYNSSTISRDFERTWRAIVHPPIKPLVYRRQKEGRKKR